MNAGLHHVKSTEAAVQPLRKAQTRKETRQMRSISEIILHCSANGPTSTIGAKEIRDYHVNVRKWKDIGYHYVIKRNGILETGRPIEQVGAHATDHNQHSIGICLVGGVARDGKTPEDNFTKEQFDRLAMLLRDLRVKFPTASIHGHNEFANKACPVFSVPKFLSEYGITKNGWDSARWPHFQPKEFGELWGAGDMPEPWVKTLDSLEKLRAAYGKPLVIKRGHVSSPLSGFESQHNGIACDIKVAEKDYDRFAKLALDNGFTYARTMPGESAVHVCVLDWEG